MPLDSVSRRLNRVRPPHVHITYDVEIGGAIEKREIPFVVGVLADLSAAGGPGQALRDRRFIEVDRDNFDSVMGKIGPELSLDVPNRLSADQPRLFVRLRQCGRSEPFAPFEAAWGCSRSQVVVGGSHFASSLASPSEAARQTSVDAGCLRGGGINA